MAKKEKETPVVVRVRVKKILLPGDYACKVLQSTSTDKHIIILAEIIPR